MPQYYCENFRGITEHLEESLDTLRLITGRRGSPMFFFSQNSARIFFFFFLDGRREPDEVPMFLSDLFLLLVHLAYFISVQPPF